MEKKIAILGGGNIGSAIAKGFLAHPSISPSQITVTRRRVERLHSLQEKGITVTADNPSAVQTASIVIVTVRPGQVRDLLQEIAPVLDPARHTLVSVVTNFSIAETEEFTGKEMPVIRAMPNTAVEVLESMTGLAANAPGGEKLPEVEELFRMVGRTYIIEEKLMAAATILNACGIAYFLRVIRAISQGGTQIGFHAPEAQMIAAQVAKGAAGLLLDSGIHPEEEIDKVTTPRGVTIAGLNEMEHHGLSSALIKGILASFNEIEKLK
jgi:pyrroline-5-carboxylate reductase